MTVLCVPALDEKPWPTLGSQVCEFIEAYLVFGPGDLRGQPVVLDDEKRALIYRMFEVFPKGHPQAGHRRWRRCAISLQKGSAKTEMGAWIAACELHPEAPVRCDGFRGRQPIGRPVNDPYIPLVAYTEEQSEELGYGALKVILEESVLAKDFDIGWERIMRWAGDGKAVALAGAPNARDGARTTFAFFDETHRWELPRLVTCHKVMLANLLKRPAAEPWALETTTAPAPGGGSVAEGTMDYARAVAEGRIKDSRLFFFHRQAAERHDLSTRGKRRDAVVEAAGPGAEWKDIEGILDEYDDPQTDPAYWQRVWLNWLVRSSDRAFDMERWRELAEPEHEVLAKALVTLGFDGSRYEDATAIVATEVETGHSWPLGIWERPPNAGDSWEVPAAEVDAVMADAFERYDVWRLYADPYYWTSELAAWAGRWGEKKVIAWPTNRWKQMAMAVQSVGAEITSGNLSHSGDPVLTRHVGNAFRRDVKIKDAEGRTMWCIQKERHDSPHKMDGAMALVLSREARRDAITAGETGRKPVPVLAIGDVGEAADRRKPEFAGVRSVTL